MKVKVGDKIYDGLVEPVMVILEDYDKENIATMPSVCKRYAQFHDGYSEDSMDSFMEFFEAEKIELSDIKLDKEYKLSKDFEVENHGNY